MTRSIVSFCPGPAHVREDILAAMATPPIPHRSAQFRELVGRVQAGLAGLLGTASPVFPVLGSGTTAMEVALRGVVRHGVLCVSSGAFGDRLSSIRRGVGLPGDALAVPPGTSVTPEILDRALRAGHFDTVALVHSETSTGGLADLPALADVVRGHPGTCLVVDAISSFGGVEIDFDALGPLAVLVSVTGKCLACPPGMSILAITRAAAQRAAGSSLGGFALDLEALVAYHDKGDVAQTPNTPLWYALDRQLGRIQAEGLAARAARHQRLAARTQQWAEERFAVFADEGARSPTVTAVENTRGIDVPELMTAVEQRGYRIANGYAALADATFRIGHMGDVTETELEGLLAAIDGWLGRG